MNAENLEFHLKNLIDKNLFLSQLLKDLYQIEPKAYLCAGVIRNWIWSMLHGQDYLFEGTEIDVIFYAPDEKNQEFVLNIKSSLVDAYPNYIWDVTNQAKVHEWYKTENGKTIAPLKSIQEALSYWPETATAIAVRIDQNNQIEVIAPFGLHDLFELKLRWNDRLVLRGVFEERLTSKQFLKRWPKLKVVN